VRPGDEVLDIGCGDGFITKRFLAEHASRIDAIDIEPSAIAEANRWNTAANVRYSLLDAVTEPFPAGPYDVIVWDGAIGHFDPSSTAAMLRKIASALKPGGLFVGSESLGAEETDHLQHWESLDELGSMLKAHFPIVQTLERSYRIGRAGEDSIRREAYWRCAIVDQRLTELDWHRQ
jgi:cyclopropane fatty-acyl-phospholipid synthase-like methyltransferase